MDLVKVKAEVEGVYKTRVTADNKYIIADEPVSKGGQNEGFNPLELLASSLATCSGMTLAMYTNRKDWDIKDIHVEVIARKKEDEELVLEKQITFTGTLTDEQKNRLLTIANQCPIHKLLSKGLVITTII